MGRDEDTRAPGAAITTALCGRWEHEPPCPLAPHHSKAHRAGEAVYIRTLFAAEPGKENDVRNRIDEALAIGWSQGPGGGTTRWKLESSQSSAITAYEAENAQRLICS